MPLELTFLFAADSDFLFPFQVDGSTDWKMRALNNLFQTPTVSMLLRPVQQAMQHIDKLFPEVLNRAPPAPSPDTGVYMKFRSQRLRIPASLLEEARDRLKRFTCSRHVRRTCDIARPMP